MSTDVDMNADPWHVVTPEQKPEQVRQDIPVQEKNPAVLSEPVPPETDAPAVSLQTDTELTGTTAGLSADENKSLPETGDSGEESSEPVLVQPQLVSAQGPEADASASGSSLPADEPAGREPAAAPESACAAVAAANEEQEKGTGAQEKEPPYGAKGTEAEHWYVSCDDLGTMSMVFGILAFFVYKGLFSILGLVLGFVSMRRHRNDRAATGIICSLINLVIFVLGFFTILVVIRMILPEIWDFVEGFLD